MKKISIIGSGNVGVNSAFFIAETGAGDVTLIDIEEGVAEGKALDLMEAAPIRGYRTGISGSSDIGAVEGSHVVVIAAGRTRTPGHDRGVHFGENAGTVKEICGHVRRIAPETLVLVATEPVDPLVKTAIDTTGFDRRRVMGVGGLLDCTRMAHFVADELGISPRDVTAMVMGSHTRSMVPVISFTRVNGIPAKMLLSADQIGKITRATCEAGSVIVDLAKRSSAYYAPSAAITKIVEAICFDTRSVISLSVMLEGEYGVAGIPLSVPCKVGAGGVEGILEVELEEDILARFRESAKPVREWLPHGGEEGP